MSTSYQTIYDSFFDRIEKDEEFLDYVNLTDVEAIELATLRSHSYLIEAISELTSKCSPDIDFMGDDENELFNENFTKNEIKLIVDIMFKIYMSRDIAKLHVFSLQFTPNEMQVFSPANERNSYLTLVQKLEKDIELAIDIYISKDRLTGRRKSIDYTIYSDY